MKNMKKQIKKWSLRITVTCFFIAGLLLLIILEPVLSYGNKSSHGKFSVFHSSAYNEYINLRLDEAEALLQSSEIYNSDLHLDICLNDGSFYPGLIEALRGRAFAWGFADKVVLRGKADFKNNFVELSEYRWRLKELLAHEMIHCLQANKLGFWNSKPVKNIPDWKWEGYAEYISRQHSDLNNLADNLRSMEKFTPGVEDSWCIYLADSTIIPRDYFNHLILLQYCMDVRKMSFLNLLKDTTSEVVIKEEMKNWFSHQSGL